MPTPHLADPHDAAQLLALVDALVRELHPGAMRRATLDCALDRDLGLDSLSRVELLARIEMGTSDFSELLMSSDLRVPYGTRICVVSPPLLDEQYSLVDELARRGYRVEIFQIPRTAASGMPEGRRRFTSHFIEDYGDELLEA